MAVGDFTPKSFQVVLGTTETEVVAAIGASKRFHVRSVIVGNVGSATQTFSLYRIPSGQTLGDRYVIGGKSKKLDGTSGTYGGGEWSSDTPFNLDTGDKITGIAGGANAIVVMVSGVEEELA